MRETVRDGEPALIVLFLVTGGPVAIVVGLYYLGQCCTWYRDKFNAYLFHQFINLVHTFPKPLFLMVSSPLRSSSALVSSRL